MFKESFPVFSALLSVVAAAVKDTEEAIHDEGNVVAKILDYKDLLPKLVDFFPHAKDLSAEIKKMSLSDYGLAAEELVVDLEITSQSAQNIIRAAFPVVDKIAELVPLAKNLVGAIQSSKEAA